MQELKIDKTRRGRQPKKIKITDRDGNFVIVDGAKEAAKLLGCAEVTVNSRFCNKKGIPLFGCILERA